MLARAAENLYWMARYLERAENTARLINSTTHVLLDLPLGATFGWANLIEVAGLDDLFRQHYPEADEEAIMRFLIEDSRNPGSIYSCVQYARENTRTLREVLPAEIWEHVNRLYLYVRANAASACRSRRDRYMVLNGVIEQRHAIVGLVAGTMLHDTAYQLVRLGRNLERADMTTRILDLNSAVRFSKDSVLNEALMERIWMSTLNALSAYQTYRRLVSMQVRSHAVIGFLLHEQRFPRTVEHCLCEMEVCLKQLPRSQQLQQQVAALRHKVAQGGTDGLDAHQLHLYLDGLQSDLAGIHDAIGRRYFRGEHQPSSLPPSADQAEMEFAQ